MCLECRFDTDHRFTRDGHTVTFYVGHVGKVGVNVTCPNTAGDEEAPCWMGGDRQDYNRCLVGYEMHESGHAMELITDPHNCDYEISSADIPIEWYYHSSVDRSGEWDCEFGWRIADGPTQPVE